MTVGNVMFTALFLGEAALKLVGLGPKAYFLVGGRVGSEV